MRALLCLATLLALTLSAAADHCTTWSTAEPEVDTGGLVAAGPRYYVDNDIAQPCCWSIWIYEESNGIDGLQREDEWREDTCHGQIASDTIIL